MAWLIENATTLAGDSWHERGLHVAGEHIVDRAERPRRLDAEGLLVLPGIVDIHGDAFERQIMPRPGVRFDVG
ncbi:MAG: alpha-D-ribose 1-methylphosphonate 5-triphosphate diphosphatase, partial [Aurantimonas coralicida]|nr:alpha-D-ribose 1-methylphosphonate 5-triphosphate diphosphatase [Aurantimonas coralicida]